jgi:hypothetical protein
MSFRDILKFGGVRFSLNSPPRARRCLLGLDLTRDFDPLDIQRWILFEERFTLFVNICVLTDDHILQNILKVQRVLPTSSC